MRLADLLDGVPGTRVQGDPSCEVRQVRQDSRKVEPGDLFVAIPGARVDGRRFVADAVSRGAVALIAEAEGEARKSDTSPHPGVTVALVPDARRALGLVAANFYGAAQALELTAVTGTSGKTTVTYLVESMLAAAGRTPGVVGTVSVRFPGRAQAASLTTPDALGLHAFFAEMRAAGCTDAVLEASSHALDQGRLHGCRFRVAALTNVTQDHLDYHETAERYFAAKAILFRELVDPGRGAAVLFADREDGRRMLREARGRTLTVATQEGGAADVTVVSRRLDGGGIRAVLATPVGPVAISSRLIGEYNLANVALAVAIAVAHGLPAPAIAAGVAAVAGVPGRLESVPNAAGVMCLVDYAHKPDALDRTLAVLRPLALGRLVVVFGCGGDRDQSKRPLMGEAAARRADVVIVTSDNPRTEEPRAIIAMIVPGVRAAGAEERTLDELRAGARGFMVEPDRRGALRAAAALVRPGDTLLVAGKGHEDYQILGTTKIHFDDREEAAAALGGA